MSWTNPPKSYKLSFMDSPDAVITSTQEFEQWQTKERARLSNPSYLPVLSDVTNAFTDEDGRPQLAAWFQFIEQPSFVKHEILTQEYIGELAKYLKSRIISFPPDRPIKILEIGAGDGRLSYFLQQTLNNPEHFQFIASDISPVQLIPFPVETSDYQASLAKHQPDLVLCSWMARGVDLSQAIRDCSSVREYLLIGESDAGICGRPWETWGFRSWSIPVPSTAPYLIDKFARFDLDSCSQYQIARTDTPGEYFHSNTISFRRL